MSEPTYRVDLSYDGDLPYPWIGKVIRVSDDLAVHSTASDSREGAFDYAQSWVRRVSSQDTTPSSVYLSEDGDILDPHEVQR